MNLSAFQRFFSPAKLNLCLYLVGKRADGYHLLETALRLIDYGDYIYLKTRSDGVIRRINVVDDVPKETDLCLRAAQCLQRYAGKEYGVDIFLEKHIPIGGGLGGGSSNAATTLLALNRQWQLHCDNAVLLQLATSLGADVPFFIHGENAWATGIGTALRSIALPTAYYVVLTPPVVVRTAEVFAQVKLTNASILKTMRHLDESGAYALSTHFENQLEDVTCFLYPQVRSYLEWLRQFGRASMSGSGASVFLETGTEQEAQVIYAQKPTHWRGFVASGLTHHPLKS